MLELPEVLTVSGQIGDTLAGKRVQNVLPPTKPHRFCWFSGDPAAYGPALKGARIAGAEGFGIFAEIAFDNGLKLCFNDGVNARYLENEKAPGSYQLLTEFDDGTRLAFTVAMYGGIVLHDGGYDNEYYTKSRAALSPFSPGFAAYYHEALAACNPRYSAKAFLATEQRFPGIGNGVLQDILLGAHVHPKRKLASLDAAEREALFTAAVDTLGEMTRLGGRDTEKDIFGNPGGYRTRLSRNTLATGCPVCGGPLTKEAYLGGAVYYCSHCQPL